MAEKSSKKGDTLMQQKIIENFQQLRAQQRSVASKMTELDSERAEHV